MIRVKIAGQELRLIVDPAQWDAIELNPAIAGRLPLRWDKGRDVEVGRVLLVGQTAPTMLEAAGRQLPVLVSTHGRPVIDETIADGQIGPDLLPFATIRWRRAGAPPPTGAMTLPLALDQGQGLVARDPRLPLPINLRFSFAHPDTEATAAAGSLLARRYDGTFDGLARAVPVFLGVMRPARPLVLERPPAIAGFRFPRLLVRISDFRGDNPLPSDPGQAGDIVIARREAPQPAQSWITIGDDYLSRCAEIAYSARPPSLTLSCAFDR